MYPSLLSYLTAVTATRATTMPSPLQLVRLCVKRLARLRRLDMCMLSQSCPKHDQVREQVLVFRFFETWRFRSSVSADDMCTQTRRCAICCDIWWTIILAQWPCRRQSMTRVSLSRFASLLAAINSYKQRRHALQKMIRNNETFFNCPLLYTPVSYSNKLATSFRWGGAARTHSQGLHGRPPPKLNAGGGPPPKLKAGAGGRPKLKGATGCGAPQLKPPALPPPNPKPLLGGGAVSLMRC